MQFENDRCLQRAWNFVDKNNEGPLAEFLFHARFDEN